VGMKEGANRGPLRYGRDLHLPQLPAAHAIEDYATQCRPEQQRPPIFPGRGLE
jgi:hypothetical protein